MKFWVRDNGVPPFHGPFSLNEVAAAVKAGRFSAACELLEAQGQSYGALKRATSWRSVQGFNLPDAPPTASDLPSHAARLGSDLGLAGLLLGMVFGGLAGLWLAMIYNAFYGIGADAFISRTTAQEVWVCVFGLGFGIVLGGGLLSAMFLLMGFLCEIVETKCARSVKFEPRLSELPERGATADHPAE